MKKINTKTAKSVNYVGFREMVEFKENSSNPSEFKRGWSLKDICKKSGKSVTVTEEVKFERNPSNPSIPSNPSELERGEG